VKCACAWSDAPIFPWAGAGACPLGMKVGLVDGSGEVLLEVDGGVAIVTLKAPDRRNALTPRMARRADRDVQ
jgi:hypothetical protein